LYIHFELPLDMLDRDFREVSFGQAQLAGILRALIAVSPLILFDAPCLRSTM
jgi:ABC-type proline/glycine betaine transport system ATPase subunit